MLIEFKMPQADQTVWINPDLVCGVMTNEQMSGRSPKTGCVVMLAGGHKVSLVQDVNEVAARVKSGWS